MKVFTSFTIFTIVISCIEGSYETIDVLSNSYNEILELIRGYCGLPVKNRQSFRFCLLENVDAMGPNLYRNCGQQLKLGDTFEEIDKYACQPGTKLQLLFQKCFIPAFNTLNTHNPSLFRVSRKCISNEENHEFQAEVHTKEEPQKLKHLLLFHVKK